MSINIYSIIEALKKSSDWKEGLSQEDFQIALASYHKELRGIVTSLRSAQGSASEGLRSSFEREDEYRGFGEDRGGLEDLFEDSRGGGESFDFGGGESGDQDEESWMEEQRRRRDRQESWREEGLEAQDEDAESLVERSLDFEKDIEESFADPAKSIKTDPHAGRVRVMAKGKRLLGVDLAISRAYQNIYGSFVSEKLSLKPIYVPWVAQIEYVITNVGIREFYNMTENELVESFLEPPEKDDSEEVVVPIQAGEAPIDWRGFNPVDPTPVREDVPSLNKSFFIPPGDWIPSQQILLNVGTSSNFFRSKQYIPLSEEIRRAGDKGIFGAYEPFESLTDEAVVVSESSDGGLEAGLVISELNKTLDAIRSEVKRLNDMLMFAINESNSSRLNKLETMRRVEAIRQHVADGFDDLAVAIIRRDEQVGQKILEMKKSGTSGADRIISSNSYRAARSFLPNNSSYHRSELFEEFAKLATAIVFPDILSQDISKYRLKGLRNLRAVQDNWNTYSGPYFERLQSIVSDKLRAFFGPGKRTNNSICRFLAAGVQRNVVLESVANHLIQKETVSNYTDNCSVCGKNIVVDRGRRRFGSEGKKAKHEHLYSEYTTDIYGLVRDNGTVITLSDLAERTFAAPNISGISPNPMSWSQIQELVSSSRMSSHQEGVIRQNYALKSMGAIPTHSISAKGPRQISGSRFKCPYSSESSKESCGMSLDISPILNSDGPWIGSASDLQARGVSIGGESRRKDVAADLDKAFSDGKITDDQRSSILKEMSTRASGGWRYSNKVFNCPTKISNIEDVSSDDLKSLGYRYLAAPISGPITEGSYEGFEDGSSTVYPASDGSGGHYMSPEHTTTYLVCGAAVSISSFDRVALSEMLSQMSDSERANLIRGMGELGVSPSDLLPLISKISDISAVNYSEDGSLELNESEAESLTRLVSYAMAAPVKLDRKVGDSDVLLKDVISNIQLVCRHGHKFSIKDSLMFGRTHTAINLFAERGGWAARGEKWGNYKNLILSEGMENFKLTRRSVKNRDGKSMIRQLSDLDMASGQFLNYNEWQQRMSIGKLRGRGAISSATFEGPDGKTYSWGDLVSLNYAWGSAGRDIWTTARMVTKRDVKTSIVQSHHEMGGSSMNDPADVTGGAATEAAMAESGIDGSGSLGREAFQARGEAGVRHLTVPVGAAVSSMLETINDFLALSVSLEPEVQGHNVGWSKPDFSKGRITGGGPVSDFDIEVGIDGIIGEVTLAMIGMTAVNPDNQDPAVFKSFSDRVLDRVAVWLERGIDGKGIYNLDARVVGTLSKSLHMEIIRAIAGIIMSEANDSFADEPEVYDSFVRSFYTTGGSPASPASFALDLAGIRQIETPSGTIASSLEDMTDLMSLKFSRSKYEVDARGKQKRTEEGWVEKLEKDVSAGRPGALKVHAAIYYARILKAASALYLADALSRIYNIYMSRRISNSYIGYDIGVDLSSGEKIIAALSQDPSFIEKVVVGVDEESAKRIASSESIRSLKGGEVETFNPWYELYYENIIGCLEVLRKQAGWVQTAGYSQKYQKLAAEYVKGAFSTMAQSDDENVSSSAREQMKYYIGEVPTTEINLGQNSSYILGMREPRERKSEKTKALIGEDSSAYEMATVFPATTAVFAKKAKLVLSSPIYVLSIGSVIYNDSFDDNFVNSIRMISRRNPDTRRAILLCRTSSLGSLGTPMDESDGVRLPQGYLESGWRVFSVEKKNIKVTPASGVSVMEHPDTLILTEDGREVGYENSALNVDSKSFFIGACTPRTKTQRVFASSLYSPKNSVVGVPLPMDYGGVSVPIQGAEAIVVVDSKIPVQLPGSNEGEVVRPDISDLLQRRPKRRAGEILLEIKRVYDSYSKARKSAEAIEGKSLSEDEVAQYKGAVRSLFSEYRALDLLVEKAECGTSRRKGKAEETQGIAETVSTKEEGLGKSFEWAYSPRASYYIPMVEPYIIKMMLEEECFSPEWGGHSLWRVGDSQDRVSLVKTCITDFVIQANRFDVAANQLNKNLGRPIAEASHLFNPKVSLIDTGLLSVAEARTNLGIRTEDYSGDFPVDQYHNAPAEVSKKFEAWLSSPGSYYRIGTDDSRDGESEVGGKDAVILVSNQLYADKSNSDRLASIQDPNSLDRISPSDIHTGTAEVRFGDPSASKTEVIETMFGEFPPSAAVPKEKTGKVLGQRAMMNAIGKYLEYSMKKKTDIFTDPILSKREASVISVGLIKYSEKLRTNIYRKSIVVNARLAALWTKLTGQD